MQLDITELTVVLKACEIAINKKAFTKEELNAFFGAWNNLTSNLEKIKRQQIVDKMYEEPVEPVEKSVVF
jgi:hypothetical protein